MNNNTQDRYGILKSFGHFVDTNKLSTKEYFTENEIEYIFDDAIEYIYDNNISKNSYHNNEHLLSVFDNSMLLFHVYKKEFDLKIHDKLFIGLASLFHDYNHSGGKLSDDENIKIALEGLSVYLETIDLNYIIDNIKDIIIVTEFPHKDIELFILQKIIRDADTMNCISDGWLDIVKSLANEYNKTLEEFIPIQIKFIENIKFNTDYCNNLLEENKDNIIKELTKILK